MKSTKTMLIAALAVGAMLVCSSSLRAQDSTKTPPAGQRPPGMRGGMNLDRLTKMLDLTDDQKTRVKPVLEDQMKKIRELRKDSSLAQEDRRAKMKTIRKEFVAKMKGILTPEQFAKFDKPGQRRKAPPAEGAGTPPPQN